MLFKTSVILSSFQAINKFELFSCTLPKAEKYGDFLAYPYSHMEIGDRILAEMYNVNFDYFPRGRIVYNKKSDIFYIYYDKCISGNISEIVKMFDGQTDVLDFDEHYQCSKCNKNYVL